MAIAPPTNELVPDVPHTNELVPNAQPMNELVTDEVTDEDRETAAPPPAKARCAQGEASEDDDDAHDDADAPPSLKVVLEFRERTGGPLPENAVGAT
jgi:hypothetical protein